jgi:hypothetical protein
MDLLQSGFGKLQTAPEPITFQGQLVRGDGNSSCRRFDISHVLTVHHRRKTDGADHLVRGVRKVISIAGCAARTPLKSVEETR